MLAERTSNGHFVARDYSTTRWLEQLTDRLRDEATAILVRVPFSDRYCPRTGDLDVIVFGDHDELLPERMELSGDFPLVDLIRLPRRGLDDLQNLALQGVIVHRLLSSRLIHDRDGDVEAKLARLAILKDYEDLQRQRIAALMDLGYYGVREIGVTGDFPELSLFWMHMAYASLLAALGDASGRLCPNVYTRPFDFAAAIQADTSIELVAPAESALRLDDDLTELGEVLWQLHEIVTTDFPEPTWPTQMRQCTRYEYRYFSEPAELRWRIAAAAELDIHCSRAAAVFYLRFMAYTLARIPMVYQRAREGIDVSFVRPQRAVLADLNKNAPQVVPLLARALGGGMPIDNSDVDVTLRWLLSLKLRVEHELARRGLQRAQLREWAPYRKPAQS